DGGGRSAGGEGRAALSPGLIRVPPEAFRAGRGGCLPAAVLGDGLGDRSGHPEVLRQRAVDLVVRAVQANTGLPWVVLYVRRWLQAPLQLPDGTLRQRDRGTPQGSSVSPVLANLSVIT